MNSKARRNRVLSLALSGAMVIGMMPFMGGNVFAQEPTESEAIVEFQPSLDEVTEPVIDAMVITDAHVIVPDDASVSPNSEHTAEPDTLDTSDAKCTEEDGSEVKLDPESTPIPNPVVEDGTESITQAEPATQDEPITQAEQTSAAENVIPDMQFKKIINNILNSTSEVPNKRPETADITPEDMAKVKSLSIRASDNVQDIEGIQYAVNLSTLSIESKIAHNLSKVSALTNLTQFTIRNNAFDLSLLQNMPKLANLRISECTGTPDFTSLGTKTELEAIYCHNVDLQSLNGLTPAQYPNLMLLSVEYCPQLSDISALETTFPNLIELSIEGSKNITDIRPIKGQTNLTTLDLEKIEITNSNRQSYQETIKSLTNLNELFMVFCAVTDQDLPMFASLVNLKELVLNCNDITNTAALSNLPKNIKVLSLYSNDIKSMDNLKDLPNLEILGLGDNQITDFSFIRSLPLLAAGSVRHLEGTKDAPSRSTYDFSNSAAPSYISDSGTVTIKNPYVGVDGNPIPFENADPGKNATYTVRYDAATNEIIFENVTPGWLHASIPYEIPLANGNVKYAKLQITGIADKEDTFTVVYDWGKDAPDNQTLPTDSTVYNSVDDAKASMDTTFTEGTYVRGTKNGKAGTWEFNGWRASGPFGDNVIKFIGSWTFIEDAFTVAYDWGSDAPDNQTLPTNSTIYNSVDDAKAAMDTQFTAQTSVSGTKNGKVGTWTFSGWSTDILADSTVRFTGFWTFTEDTFTVTYDWGKDVPDNQTLPTDSTLYNSVDEAKAAMDSKFTAQTSVSGTKNGKVGTWTFSGWTPNTLANNVVKFTGSWTFTQDAFTVIYDWGSDTPDNQTLPSDSTVYNSVDEAKAAMDSKFTVQTSVSGTKNGKAGTWTFSGWTSNTLANNVVKFTGSWAFTEDAFTVTYDWGSDTPNNQTLPSDSTVYNSVAEAKAAMDSKFTARTSISGTKNGKEGTWKFSGWTAHDPAEDNVVKFTGSWTFTEKVAPTPVDPDKPKTGDTSNIALWTALLVVSGGIVVAATRKKRKSN